MSSSPESEPADQLARMFPAFDRAFSRWAQTLLESSGVSTSRARLLGVLHCKGPQIMCGLSDELGVTARNVTALVDGLESEGLVRRSPHPNDRRATVVALTPQGLALADKMLGPFHDQVTGLFCELSERDRKELTRLMGELLAALRRRGQAC
jgi:DNA-binding MarR family transcriptional regulator